MRWQVGQRQGVSKMAAGDGKQDGTRGPARQEVRQRGEGEMVSKCEGEKS